MQKWLGQESFQKELEEQTGAVYVVIEETGKEAAVIETVLLEMAEGLPPKVAEWYCVPNWKEKGQFTKVCLPRGNGDIWEQDMEMLVQRAEELFEEQWEKEKEKTDWEVWREDTAANLLGPINEYWSAPELVAYQNGLAEEVLKELMDLEEPDGRQWLPEPLQRAKERPVVRGEALSRAILAGYPEYKGERRWKPGLMQEASGGYLFLSAEEVITGPGAWRCLRDAMLREELPGPGAFPFRMQVILYGSATLYRALKETEADFGYLFRQTVRLPSFTEDTAKGRIAWEAYLQEACAEKGLAMGNITEVILKELSREEDVRGQLPCCFDRSLPILEKGFLYCAQEGKDCLDWETVEQVLDFRREERKEQSRRIFEENRTRLEEVSIEGREIGTVNGLAVWDMGYFRMGQPVRMTAQYRNKGVRIDSAERRVGLAGRIFSKSIEVLNSYLGGMGRSNRKEILLSCEQSDCPIEGDSALLAQAYGVLSLLGEFPVCRSIAVTGSLNAMGKVLPVGGITEKVEGFYDFCQWKKAERASEKEEINGVVFPAANIPDLKLSGDIQKAVEKGEFRLYPIDFIEEGIPILMEAAPAVVLRRAGRRL